jgi:hypothetical protein
MLQKGDIYQNNIYPEKKPQLIEIARKYPE